MTRSIRHEVVVEKASLTEFAIAMAQDLRPARRTINDWCVEKWDCSL
jgi:hypothetical protein